MDRAGDLAQLAFSYIPAVVAVGFVVLAYFFIALERGRGGHDDAQAGLKLVLWSIVLAGVQHAAAGATELLGYVLGGFKGGAGPIREALPPMLVGGGAAFAIIKFLLPRTNSATAKRPERLALGALGTIHGAIALVGVSGFVSGIFKSAAWSQTSSAMAAAIVSLAVAYVAVTRLGAQSGWSMMSPPPGGGGYPPAGPGFPR